jgi:hypothetical protein
MATTVTDLLYVMLFAVAFPLWDYFVFWHFNASHEPIPVGLGRGSGQKPAVTRGPSSLSGRRCG